jgi:hypothetical protein
MSDQTDGGLESVKRLFQKYCLFGLPFILKFAVSYLLMETWFIRVQWCIILISTGLAVCPVMHTDSDAREHHSPSRKIKNRTSIHVFNTKLCYGGQSSVGTFLRFLSFSAIYTISLPMSSLWLSIIWIINAASYNNTLWRCCNSCSKICFFVYIAGDVNMVLFLL